MNRQLLNYIFPILVLISLGFQITAALSSTKFSIPKRLQGNNNTLISFLSPLQNKYNPVDLGMGTPDFKPPEFVRSAMSDATWGDHRFSQYTKSSGHPRLVNAIAQLYSKLLNKTLDPDDNVNIGIGATEILYATVQSHTEPGDEWIVIEPYFDTYNFIIKASFGIPKFVPLRSNKPNGGSTSKDWTFDRDEMARAFNNRTKGIILNNPHNPTGKIFTYEELKFIADLAKKWDTLVVSDEVYEFLIYDDNKFIRIATLPNMFERTITLGSVSKTFSATGYRLGWAYGGAQVLNNLKFIQYPLIVSVPTLIQEAFARVFEKELINLHTPRSYLMNIKNNFERKRDYLIQIIEKLGMSVIVPDSGYFIVANSSSFGNLENYGMETGRGMRFAKWLMEKVGIEGYPLSRFYGSEKNKYLGEDGVRFTFVKTDSILEEAERRVLEFKLRK